MTMNNKLKLKSINKSIQGARSSLKRLNKEIIEIKKQIEISKKLLPDIELIENNYKRMGREHMLKGNPVYLSKRKLYDEYKSGELSNKLKNRELLKEEAELKIENSLQEKEKIEQEALNFVNTNNRINLNNEKNKTLSKKENEDVNIQYDVTNIDNKKEKCFKAEWSNIRFKDGYILIKNQNTIFKKNYVQSREYIDKIKTYYSFKNVPNLVVIYSQNNIIRIENEEHLFFHLDYFNSTGQLFDFTVDIRPNISLWRKYTKDYYRNKLGYLMHTESLNLLCEICTDKYPILPAAELVINSNGGQQIHNSFLFPIFKNKILYYFWESTSENKATYIFRVPDFESKDLQKIYDFITGNTINKRKSIISSRKLRIDLNYLKRIMHNDDWLFHLKNSIY